MIKLFRDIRQRLLSEGKTGKYFKYVIGETILVVIGILIALQINNWNEDRKNRSTEADYYCRILDDFVLNEMLINENYEQINHKIQLTKELIKDIHKIPNVKGTIVNKYIATVRQDVFVPSTITFDDITSSGQLKLLKDIELKKRLIEHSTFLNNTIDLLEENRNEIVKRSTNYDLITEVGYQDVDYMKKELDEEHIALLPKIDWTNDPTHRYFIKTQDNLIFILGMQIRQRQHYSNLKQEIQEPIKLLKDKNCK